MFYLDLNIESDNFINTYSKYFNNDYENYYHNIKYNLPKIVETQNNFCSNYQQTCVIRALQIA
jgi:hypothetical protein